MIPLTPAALMLSLAAVGLHPAALINRSLPCYELPANIRTTPDVRRAVLTLLARSPTLRAQCTKIASAPRTVVSLAVSLRPFDARTRARSTARRYPSGLLTVDVEIPPASQDFAELLAHELEHVTEFIEGVDFSALAESGDGAGRCIGGSFESVRAQQAGRAAALEIDSARKTAEVPAPRHRSRNAPLPPVTRWR